MQYNDDARLDTSGVSDARGSGGLGGRGVAIGGGGIGVISVVIYLLISVLGGGSGTDPSTVLGQLGQSGQPATADNTTLSQECHTGADANTKTDCATVANIDSIQDYWAGELPALGTPYTP